MEKQKEMATTSSGSSALPWWLLSSSATLKKCRSFFNMASQSCIYMTTIYLCAAVPRFGNTPAGSMSQSSGPVLFRPPLSYVTSLFFICSLLFFSKEKQKGEHLWIIQKNQSPTHTDTDTSTDPPLYFPPLFNGLHFGRHITTSRSFVVSSVD